MKIAIDVMGGDNFPEANIDGVFEYIEDSNNPMIPRNIMIFFKLYVSRIDLKACLSIKISPSGERTAVAYAPGTRINTPSITA